MKGISKSTIARANVDEQEHVVRFALRWPSTYVFGTADRYKKPAHPLCLLAPFCCLVDNGIPVIVTSQVMTPDNPTLHLHFDQFRFPF